MKKTLTSLPFLLTVILLILGAVAVQQYFSYVGPGLARQADLKAELTALEVEKEKLLLLNRAVEERLRSENTTDIYYYIKFIVVGGLIGGIGLYVWQGYDRRKESWARAVDGMFAIQTEEANGIKWKIDPNKTFTSAIGVADTGQIAELPVAKEVHADRQLAYNQAVQRTRTAIATTSDGQGIRYAAHAKMLAGAYDKPPKMLSTSDGENYEEVPNEPIPVMSLTQAWEESEKGNWVIGQSTIDGKKCIVNLRKVVHMAVIGAPGVGKTESTGLLIASYAVEDGWIVIALDGKGGSDWTSYDEYFEVQETNEHVFHLQFAEIAKEHNRRNAILKQNGWKTIDESNGQIPHVLVVLEEFGALLQNIQMTDKELYGRMLTAVVNLMKLSRSTGIHFCIIDQTLADCPSEIKGIIKFYVAYKLNGGIGNSVKMYYLDKLADSGEFCSSDAPDNKFKAWHTSKEFDRLPIGKREWHILPNLPEAPTAGVLTDFTSKKMLKQAELEDEGEKNTSQDQLIINTYNQTGSINKVTEAVFGKGKKGKYYADKVKPVLIREGLLNE